MEHASWSSPIMAYYGEGVCCWCESRGGGTCFIILGSLNVSSKEPVRE